ncbi:MAG: hypothetical protein AAF609_16685 [Cyanobacteria bacterium P01_C01_bin.120]
MLSTLETISQPYVIAGKTVSALAIATYKTLTSQQAQRIYKDAFIITSVVVQVTFWLAVLASLYAIKTGRAFRRYYEAEWAADVQRFLSYPDCCIAVAESASEPVAATTEAVQPAIPDAVQAILNGNVKTTKKLRSIATHFDIRWRNAHGEGRHLLNAEIRDALSDRPEISSAL